MPRARLLLLTLTIAEIELPPNPNSPAVIHTMKNQILAVFLAPQSPQPLPHIHL